MSNSIIPHVNSHKDLGLTLSKDLSWDKHYKDITAHAYKMLGLIRNTFSPTHSPSTLVRLYIIGKITVTLLYASLASSLNERHFKP